METKIILKMNALCPNDKYYHLINLINAKHGKEKIECINFVKNKLLFYEKKEQDIVLQERQVLKEWKDIIEKKEKKLANIEDVFNRSKQFSILFHQLLDHLKDDYGNIYRETVEIPDDDKDESMQHDESINDDLFDNEKNEVDSQTLTLCDNKQKIDNYGFENTESKESHATNKESVDDKNNVGDISQENLIVTKLDDEKKIDCTFTKNAILTSLENCYTLNNVNKDDCFINLWEKSIEDNLSHEKVSISENKEDSNDVRNKSTEENSSWYEKLQMLTEVCEMDISDLSETDLMSYEGNSDIFDSIKEIKSQNDNENNETEKLNDNLYKSDQERIEVESEDKLSEGTCVDNVSNISSVSGSSSVESQIDSTTDSNNCNCSSKNFAETTVEQNEVSSEIICNVENQEKDNKCIDNSLITGNFGVNVSYEKKKVEENNQEKKSFEVTEINIRGKTVDEFLKQFETEEFFQNQLSKKKNENNDGVADIFIKEEKQEGNYENSQMMIQIKSDNNEDIKSGEFSDLNNEEVYSENMDKNTGFETEIEENENAEPIAIESDVSCKTGDIKEYIPCEVKSEVDDSANVNSAEYLHGIGVENILIRNRNTVDYPRRMKKEEKIIYTSNQLENESLELEKILDSDNVENFNSAENQRIKYVIKILILIFIAYKIFNFLTTDSKKISNPHSL